MKVHRLVKGNVVVHIRIGKTEAQMKTKVGDSADTSVPQMTPMEANRKVNELLRQGFKNQNAVTPA